MARAASYSYDNYPYVLQAASTSAIRLNAERLHHVGCDRLQRVMLPDVFINGYSELLVSSSIASEAPGLEF